MNKGGLATKKKWSIIKENYRKTNPSFCKNCNSILPYKKRKNKFCSSSCSASYNNKQRQFEPLADKRTKIANCKNCKIEVEINIRGSINNAYCDVCRDIKLKEYYKEYYNNERLCKKCDNIIQRKYKTICIDCKSDLQIYRENCKFNFNIFNYPDEFNLKSIEKYGWYEATNRGNNLNGISRDHIYSVSDGFNNNINPHIINHPANCQLLRHSINNSKNNNSDITLDELCIKINNWNKKYDGVAE